jgi:hypothetical protein
LEQKTSPGGREVAGPRTPQSLHPTPAASSSSFNITGFTNVNPAPPPHGNWEGRFFHLSRRSTTSSKLRRIPRPPSAAPAAGGRGIPVSRV